MPNIANDLPLVRDGKPSREAVQWYAWFHDVPLSKAYQVIKTEAKRLGYI